VGAQHIPLLSPKAFGEFTPQEFKDYVTQLYQEPPKPPPPADFTVTLNKKGIITVRINRDPKYLLKSEVTAIATQLGWSQQDTWNFLTQKRKISIKGSAQ